MMKTYIVYKITNKKNGKPYIGKTEYSLEHRWNRHLSSARNGSKFRFHSAIRKYGEDCWDLSVIETYQTEDENFINEKETHFIKLFESDTKGYNATSGGTGGWMLPRCSQEVREQWRNDISTRTTGFNNPNYSGYSDEELINFGMKFIEKYNFIPGLKRLIKFCKNELNVNFPKSFSKNRFGGSRKNYTKLLEDRSGLTFDPNHRTIEERKIIAQKASINSTIMWQQRRNKNAQD
jgi:group I intron endonuclease